MDNHDRRSFPVPVTPSSSTCGCGGCACDAPASEKDAQALLHSASSHVHAHGHGHDHDHDSCGCGAACAPAVSEEPVWQTEVPVLRLRVPAMDCNVEESEIRRALASHEGIISLHFDLGRRVLSVQTEEAQWPRVESALGQLGFDSQRLAAQGVSPELERAERRRTLQRMVGALIAAVLSEGISVWTPEASWTWRAAGMALALLAIVLAGASTYRKGVAALRMGRLNINALMSVAVSGAFLIGDWPEASMVMALYALAEWIEARAVDRARNAVKGLMALAPEDAELRLPDGRWQRRPSRDITVGSSIRLRPGERVPLDGVVEEGLSSINQASITGESLPVEKGVGAQVFAGTVNVDAELIVRVTAPANDSLLERIIHAVEQAQATRAPMQRWVDQFAAIYTPAVFVLALAVALTGPWLWGWTWLASIYKALVLLVIACPCALVISTPVTVVSALASAARQGILIKGGVFLEQARRLRVVALDKTGTLTTGRPTLVATQWCIPEQERAAALAGARALASRSDHPVSQAIAAGLASSSMPLSVTRLQAEAGRGVRGEIEGRTWRLANHRWVEELRLCSPELEARMAEYEKAGQSITLLADEEQVLAFFAVADSLKASTVQALQSLDALGLTTVMLTGDNAATANAIAKAAGVAQLRANLLPEQKLEAIRELQAHQGATAMVGDGINDAPALAGADLGVAMGGAGTHIAMESADVVIMNDDLRQLPLMVRLSRRTHAVLWQNIALALGIKLVFLVLAIMDSASMWMAVFADMGASLLVVANGLRLRRPLRPQ